MPETEPAHTVRIRDCALYVDERRLPLISGEFHFWRVQRSNWEAVLDGCRELGLEMLATYVAWNYHELEPGRFDFTGETCPERDLRGFLELCRERDFPVIMRPGPFIYAEWPHGGPPERVANLPRLSDAFLSESKVYVDAVSAVLRPFLATRGGPVVLVQADNEPWPNLRARCEELGAAGGGGPFADWLREAYGGRIEALNRAWRAAFTDWTEPAIFFEECYINRSLPLNARLLPAPRYTRRYSDGQRFVEDYATRIIAAVAALYRDAGIDVPLYMNGWHPYAQNFAQAMQTVDLAGVDGLHRHPAFFDPAAPEFENDYRWYTESIKMTLHDTGGIGYAAEMGIGHPTVGLARRLTFAPKPEHNLFDYLFYMAHGMKAWNWYTLVDRDNWVCGALNTFGRPTPYADSVREALKVAAAVDVSTLQPLKTCSLVTHKGHRYTDSGNWAAVFDALTGADLDFDLVDPACRNPAAPLCFYGGADWLPREAADALREYVEHGGTLVCFTRRPETDAGGGALDPFGLPEPAMVRPVSCPFEIVCGEHRLRIAGGGHHGTVFLAGYRRLPEDAEPVYAVLSAAARTELVDIGLGAGERKRFIMGCRRPLGRGSVILLGINPNPALSDLARRLSGVSYAVRTDTPRVLTHPWRRPGGGVVIFAVNLSPQGTYARIALDTDYLGLNGPLRARDVRDEQDLDLAAGPDAALTPYLRPHDVGVWLLEETGA
ncbi:MAG: beta-galactosidase [Lentisphaerae bacterium]|nr:beta-galactosidase [Lentisphaerota bacterium]